MSKANKLKCYGCIILGEDEWKEKNHMEKLSNWKPGDNFN